MTDHDVERPPVPDEFATLLTILDRRRSCRGFLPRRVDLGTVKRLLLAAQQTPSWSNVQPWQVVVVSGDALDHLRRDMRESTQPVGPDLAFPSSYEGVYQERRRSSGWQLYGAMGVQRGGREQSRAEGARNFDFFGAPHAAFITTERSLGVYGVLDCGLYVQSFLLAAQALGIDTISQAALATRAAFLRSWLDLPDNRVVVCGVSFGYADPDHPSRSFVTDRAELSEVATFLD